MSLRSFKRVGLGSLLVGAGCVGAGFLACSAPAPAGSVKASPSTTEEAYAAAKAEARAKVVGTADREIADLLASRPDLLVHPDGTTVGVNAYYCSANIGTEPFTVHLKNDAGTVVVQIPKPVYTVAIAISIATTATSATACTETSIRGFHTELSFSAKQVGTLLTAVGESLPPDSLPAPPYLLNGEISSFPIFTLDGANTQTNYDLAQLYGELVEGNPALGIPIPNEHVNPGSALNFYVPAVDNPDGGASITEAYTTPAAFPVGGSAGTMTWNPNPALNMTATLVLENELSYPTTCELVPITPASEMVLASITIPKTLDCTPPDATTSCAAAAALDPLGAPLANCAGDYCCADLTTCVEDTTPGGCAELASCFVTASVACVNACDAGVTCITACGSNATAAEEVGECEASLPASTTNAGNVLFGALFCVSAQEGNNEGNTVACTSCAPTNSCPIP